MEIVTEKREEGVSAKGIFMDPGPSALENLFQSCPGGSDVGEQGLSLELLERG